MRDLKNISKEKSTDQKLLHQRQQQHHIHLSSKTKISPLKKSDGPHKDIQFQNSIGNIKSMKRNVSTSAKTAISRNISIRPSSHNSRPSTLTIKPSKTIPPKELKQKILASSNSLHKKTTPQKSLTAPSDVASEVERLKKAREERRTKQDAIKKEKLELAKLHGSKVDTLIYRQIIDEFRLEFEKMWKVEAKVLAQNEVSQDVQIRVCIRKRPLSQKGILFLSLLYFFLK